MGLIKHFFCVNARGSPVALRSFLTEPTQSVIETFYSRVSQDNPPPPVFRADNLSFCYIVFNSLYFGLATEDVMAPSLLLELLHRIASVIGDYAGQCSEMSMQKNLALVYEIIDEVLSFGCPQATDPSSLLHLVHNKVQYSPGLLKEIDVLGVFSVRQFDRPLALTNQQRDKGSNEIFFILNERLEMSLDAGNQAVRTLITGTGTIRSFLQGNPSVLIQFDPQMSVASRGMALYTLPYDDISFAPYVQTQGFDADRSITFAPPEGQSTLFHYRCSRTVNPPFRLAPVFEKKEAKVVVVRIAVTATFPAEAEATDVVVTFQCPVEISSASCELPPSLADAQSGEYDARARVVRWKIPEFKGLQEYSARFRFMFDAGIPCAAEGLLGPVSMDFTIKGLLTSGMSIKNYIVSTSGTPSPPRRWVKEITTSGCYTYDFI